MRRAKYKWELLLPRELLFSGLKTTQWLQETTAKQAQRICISSDIAEISIHFLVIIQGVDPSPPKRTVSLWTHVRCSAMVSLLHVTWCNTAYYSYYRGRSFSGLRCPLRVWAHAWRCRITNEKKILVTFLEVRTKRVNTLYRPKQQQHTTKTDESVLVVYEVDPQI